MIQPQSEQCAWRVNVIFIATLTGVALIVNFSLTIWAGKSLTAVNAIATLIEGECSHVTSMDSWLHLGINVIGILLLGGSNYTMQCLVSPTREELDTVHSTGGSLSIGTSSATNLRRVHWSRTIVWGFLLLSSLPLAFV